MTRSYWIRMGPCDWYPYKKRNLEHGTIERRMSCEWKQRLQVVISASQEHQELPATMKQQKQGTDPFLEFTEGALPY